MTTDNTNYLPQGELDNDAGSDISGNELDAGSVQLAQAVDEAARPVQMPRGGQVILVPVHPGQVLTLPTDSADGLQAKIGPEGNLAIVVDGRTIIFQGYLNANDEASLHILTKSGAEIDIVDVVAATDPNLDIATAAGPAAGAQGDSTGGSGIFTPFGPGAGLDSIGAEGVLGGTELAYRLIDDERKQYARAEEVAPSEATVSTLALVNPDGAAFLKEDVATPVALIAVPGAGDQVTQIVLDNIPAGWSVNQAGIALSSGTVASVTLIGDTLTINITGAVPSVPLTAIVMVTAASDSDVDGADLVVQATATDGTASATASSSFNVTVDAVLDQYLDVSQDASPSGAESAASQLVGLNLSAALAGGAGNPFANSFAGGGDGDGSEQLPLTAQITVPNTTIDLALAAGFPAGTTLTETAPESGVWTLGATNAANLQAALSFVQAVVPAGFDGVINGQVAVTTEEANTPQSNVPASGNEPDTSDNSATDTTQFSITVSNTHGNAISGEIAFAEDAVFNQYDQSLPQTSVLGQIGFAGVVQLGVGEALTALTITGIPAGATLTINGAAIVNGVALTAAQLADWIGGQPILVTPPADRDNDFNLSFSGQTTDSSSGAVSPIGGSVAVLVDAAADDPTNVTIDAVSSLGEEQFLPYETGTVKVAASFGDAADGTEAHSLTITAPAGFVLTGVADADGVPLGNFSGLGTGTVTVTIPGGDAGVSNLVFNIQAPGIYAGANPPSFAVTATAIDTPTDFGSGAGKADDAANNAASESAGDAVGFQPDHADGKTSGTVAVTEDSLPDQYLGNFSTVVGGTVHLNLAPADNEQFLSVTIDNIPLGVVISDGLQTVTGTGSNSITIQAAQLGTVTLTQPTDDASNDYTLSYTAAIKDPTSNETATINGSLAVTVDAVADQPTDLDATVSPRGFAYSVAESKETGEATLFRIDLDSGAVKEVGSVTVPNSTQPDIEGLAFNAANGLLYGFTTGPGGNNKLLVSIDPATAATTVVGAAAPVGEMGTEFVGNTLYAVVGSGNTSQLYTVSTTTGGFTAVGGTTGANIAIDGMAYNSDTGKMYGLDKNGTNTFLYEINLATGAASNPVLVGNNVDLQNLAYGQDGKLWAVDRVSGQIFQIDTAGGMTLASTVPVRYFQGDGFESLAIAPNAANAVEPGSKFGFGFTADFGDHLDGSEDHTVLIKLPDATWDDSSASPAPTTLGAGNAYGVPAGTYLIVDADALIDPATGIAKGSVLLSAPEGASGDQNFTVYAVAKDGELPGDAVNPALELEGNNLSVVSTDQVVHMAAIKPSAEDVTAKVDEDGIPAVGNNDSKPGDDNADVAPDTIPGEATWREDLPVDWNGNVGSIALAAGDWSGLRTLGNNSIVAVGTGSGLLQGYDSADMQGGAPKAGATPIFEVQIIDAATGVYEVRLLKPMMHPDSNNPADNATDDGAGSYEDNLTVPVNVTYSNVAGSTTKTLSISVDDDSPTIAIAATGQTQTKIVSGQAYLIVDEDNIAGGVNDGKPGDDSGLPNGVATGSLSASAGADQPGAFSLDAVSGVLKDAGGVSNILTASGHTVGLSQAGNVITGRDSVTNGTVFTLTLNSNGSFSFDLDKPLKHSVAGTEDDILLSFGAKVTDKDGDAAMTQIRVLVDDDLPVANPLSKTATDSHAVDTNLLLVLDVSGSMADPSGLTGLNKLQLAVAAINELVEQYDAKGNVMIQIVTFSSNAEVQDYGNSNGVWLTVDQAKQFLAGVSAGEYTNYDEALTDAMSAYGNSGKIAGAQNIAYFLSDGNPNRPNGDAGIDGGEETAWTNFLKANDINAFALGFGQPGDVDAVQLHPVAYNGAAEVNTNATVVTDLNLLTASLVSTVTASVSGNLRTDGGNTIGADGSGYVGQVTFNGANFSFDGTTITRTGAALAFTQAAGVLTFEADGFKFAVDMNSGAYTYSVADDAVLPAASAFGFTLQDADGDTASSTLQVTITDSDNAPIVRDDHIMTNVTGGNGTSILVPESAFLWNDTDADGNALGFGAISDIANLKSVTHAGHDVTIVDNNSNGGEYTYTASTNGLSDTGDVDVNRSQSGESTLDGNGLDNILVGRNGAADIINGYEGNDVLIGGSANDTLDGGSGHDLLIGGAGNDTLILSSASGDHDTITVSSVLDGNDTVKNFGDGVNNGGAASQDTVNLDPLFDSLGVATDARESRVQVTDGGNDAVVTIDTTGNGFDAGDLQITLSGIALPTHITVGTDPADDLQLGAL